MHTLSKKKSKVSPAEKYSNKKQSHSRNHSKTQQSPTAKKSINKQQIKSTIQKFLYAQPSSAKVSQTKQQVKRPNKLKTKIQIQIPNIRTSLTPKRLNETTNKLEYKQRQVQSTKAADNTKLFTNSGRYDLKQFFENRNFNQNKQSSKQIREESYSGKAITRQMSRLEQRKIQDTTMKINNKAKEDEFDVRCALTDQQFEKFGDRFPEKFKRIALLGRGGFSVVWLGVHRSSKRKVAIKQILTKNPHQTHLKQIWFGSYFFEKGGEPRQQFQNHIGINNICKLYSYQIKSLDSWLFYEVCEQSLGSSLFQLKNEINNGEKSYRVFYKQLIKRMRQNIGQLRKLIIQISKALYLLNSHNIVHSDLKTQNILIKVKRKQDSAGSYIKSLKLIDFGSSFLFTNLKQFSMATPEYMPPQILNYILFQNKLQYDVMMLNKMEKYKNPWTIDVWSLGCIILEIITGVPLWMSLPTRIEDSNIKTTGLFAVKGRIFQKIIQKQIQVINNIDYYISQQNNSGIIPDKKIITVLKNMLSLQPEQRISPYEILNYFGVECQPHKIPFY